MANKKFNDATEQEIHDALANAYEALKEKKYDPITQLAYYLMSEDGCYITTYNNARGRLEELDNDEMIMHLLKYYFDEQL